MKKICFVAEYMYCGGTEKSLLALLDMMDRKKYTITLLLLKKRGELLNQLPKDIEVCEIPLPEDEEDDLLIGRGAALKKAVKKRKFILAMHKAIRGVKMMSGGKGDSERRLWYYENISPKIKEYPKKFDVVIDYMGYGLFNTFYAAKKITAKIKISWVHFEPVHAMPDFDVFKNILSDYNYIMCVSKNSKHQMEKLIPELSDRYKVFYNIVNVKDIQFKATEEKICKNPNEINVVSVGRLTFQKGFDIGVEVIKHLVEDGYPIQWYLIGEGSQRKELEELIRKSGVAQKHIKLLGRQLNPYPYISMCDIYFQPSRHEGYGIAVAEARAFAKPIVVTDFAGAREQLIDGETGIISKCEVEALYHSLKKLLDNPELMKYLSQNLERQMQENCQIQEFERILDQA